ncbi:short-chain dehydrogenases protein [Fusarium flagelliforme]|uniref:Short-chain dehydrogenases protein n=1 Tax=Fusarium flagelliforme TaxID=2675880 RepID=A0A395MWF2_9HYPO|nr:short-chain dehydrogenases protein [Fusarium flagelliforme]
MSSVALIFGAGSNVGSSVAKGFLAKGYKVALASRSQNPETSTETELHIPTDCSDTDSILQAFAKTKSEFGIPNVVVYNTFAGQWNSAENIFEVSLDHFQSSTTVNITSVYAAAQEAVKGWTELPQSSKNTFILTGNCANVTPLPVLMTLTVGKSGSASLMEMAAKSYKDKGYRFYYTDERLEDGAPMWNGVTAQAHADLYVDLAEAEEQREWYQTFVSGIGYKKLPAPKID